MFKARKKRNLKFIHCHFLVFLCILLNLVFFWLSFDNTLFFHHVQCARLIQILGWLRVAKKAKRILVASVSVTHCISPSGRCTESRYKDSKFFEDMSTKVRVYYFGSMFACSCKANNIVNIVYNLVFFPFIRTLELPCVNLILTLLFFFHGQKMSLHHSISFTYNLVHWAKKEASRVLQYKVQKPSSAVVLGSGAWVTCIFATAQLMVKGTCVHE